MRNHFVKWVLIAAASASVFFFQNCAKDFNADEFNSSDGSSLGNVAPTLLGQSPNQTLSQGQNIQLSVDAEGPGLTYEWFKNGTLIPSASTSLFTVTNAQPTDSGQYSFRVSNLFGEVTGSMMVTVNAVAGSPPPSPSPTPQPKPVCQIWYQLKNDSVTAPAARDGVFSEYSSGQDKDCNDGTCGMRMGAACTSGDEVRLRYQFQFFSNLAPEVTSPWSGFSGIVQWGAWSTLFNQFHVTDECRAPLMCGIRIVAETRSGQVCNISYQYKSAGRFSVIASNGNFALLPDMGTRDENCSGGTCGMMATMTCP